MSPVRLLLMLANVFSGYKCAKFDGYTCISYNLIDLKVSSGFFNVFFVKIEVSGKNVRNLMNFME